MINEGVDNINPFKMYLAVNKLRAINAGKKDWLDFFIYRNKRRFKLR